MVSRKKRVIEYSSTLKDWKLKSRIQGWGINNNSTTTSSYLLNTYVPSNLLSVS